MCSGIEQPFSFYINQKTKFGQKIYSDNWVFDFCDNKGPAELPMQHQVQSEETFSKSFN